MKEYIINIIYVSIFTIILELILPDSKTKKHVNSMIGLVITLVTIVPIINVFNTDISIETLSSKIKEEYSQSMVEYDFTKYENKHIISSVKKQIEADMIKKCEILGFDVEKVLLEMNEKYLIEEIVIYIKNLENINDAKEIINYITDTYNVNKQKITVIRGERTND